LFEVIDTATPLEDARYAAVFAALRAIAPECRFVVLKSAPDAPPPAPPSFAWLAAYHHDLDGALRGFKYLAQKSGAAYDPADPKGRKVLDSIARHLQTIERLKTELVDRLLPVAFADLRAEDPAP
jgi:hypothetical protein